MNARRASALITAAACLLAAAQLRAQSAGQSDAPRGQALYARFGCYECHQYSGSGYQGAPGGAPLVPLPLTREAFRAYLRNPPMPRRMPPYTAKLLNDTEADALYAFIRSLPPPRPLAEIPLLDGIAKEIRAGAQH
ncbi:MAG TPA: c-type cytochrome [Gammaproteobacteria bacterium]|nr:c-type cytochrome [Gammaproteobacteria bacterium]